MRVTHVITRLIVGGAQENTVSSVLGLRERPGLEVDLISGPTHGSEGSLERCLENIPAALTVTPNLVREVHPIRDCAALRDLTRLFRARRPDIVHTHSSKAGILGRLAAHRAGVPVIVHTVHGPPFGRFQGWLANTLFTATERYAASKTTHFVTVADAMTRQFLAAGIGGPEQFTRIFSGFPIEAFVEAHNDLNVRARLGLRPDDFVVGKIARLFELKGHDDLFSAAPRLIQGCPRIKFLLVGGGPWRGRFEATVRKLGVEKHFVFAGLVPPSQMPAMVGIMDALVHLSYREGIPRALPQAMAARKPVVAYDCDGAAEVCLHNETGFLVPAGDLNKLTAHVLALAAHPELRARLSSRGQALALECFPVERMVSALHSLYEKLMRPQSRPGREPSSPASAPP